MLRINRTVLAVMMASIMIILSACSGSSTEPTNNNASTNSNGAVDENKVVDVSFFAVPSSDVIDLKTNWFTGYVKETFKLNIQWNIAPSSDYLTKQSLLLSSGNYPDAFWSGSFSPSDILKYSKQGIIVPLNSYIEKYAPNLTKAMETAPGLKQAMTAPDGKIYGVPSYNSCIHCYWGQKFWINTDNLNKFGLSMPTTTDELTNVLQTFKDNGLVPLSGTSDGFDPTIFLMNAFIYDNGSDFFNVEDGKVSYAPVQEGWKKGLTYIRDLYAKGLLDKQAFSQKSEVIKQLAAQNKVGVVPYLYSAGFIDTANPNYPNWSTVPPLKGPDGTQYAAFSGNTPKSLTFVVTKNATEEQIVRMIKLVDFIYTPEGTQMMNFGQEGKYWTKAGDGVKGLSGEQALFITQSDKFYSAGAKQNEGWNQMGPIFQNTTWRNGFVEAKAPFSADGLESLLMLETMKNYAGHQPKQVYPGVIWIQPQEYQNFALLKTNIEQYVKQSMAQFINGSKSIENDWQTYVEGLQKLGLPQYLEMAQKAMTEPFDTSAFQSDPKTVEFLSSLK
ncbi:putative aldouronate transport system substrate-binding protein [Paenibacillus rhizosphaerae]|uniref:Putative aldouronate transport system substrate-binding protein n=1 Tax=Paenibacillus rhizosphaerae TaxID=297318 RepID=A0A839TXU8_9BACL|nr:extracellular solute-binding protein [Paenibacillus rhizosphaerae]MBB3131313.1 putative aldouronate transport system substrate-binding protein [Paenibacillus rhizosphaerae]